MSLLRFLLRRMLLLMPVVGLSAACPAESEERPDASPRIDGAPDTDAAAVVDGSMSDVDASRLCRTIEFGRCRTMEDEPCMGSGGDLVYTHLAAGDVVHPVMGFQGLPMFVIFARTSGIDPGPPDDYQQWPEIDAAMVTGDMVEVSSYTFGARFELLSGDTYQSEELLFILGGDPADVIGETLDLDMELADRTNATRCGKLSFTVGSIEDMPM